MATPNPKTPTKTKAKADKTKDQTSKPKDESRDSLTGPANGAANSTNSAAGTIISPILSLDPSEFILTNSELAEDDKFDDVLTTLAIRKPGPLEFFRTNPIVTAHDNVAILEFEDTKYMVTKNMVAPFDGAARVYHLMTCVSQSGLVFLWDRKTGNNPWNNSGKKAAVTSLTSWVRMYSVEGAGQYSVVVSASTVEPQFPKETLIELMAIAFGDNVISDKSHDAYKHLMGK